MPYDITITNKETGRDIEMTIEDLKFIKELLEEFDETKIDFELKEVKDEGIRRK